MRLVSAWPAVDWLPLREAASTSWAALRRWPHPAGPQTPEAPADPEPVRRAMRALLGDLGGGGRLRLALAITRCQDVRCLWHLRPTLMQAIAAERGELQARSAVASLDPLFRQGWPQAPVSRPALRG